MIIEKIKSHIPGSKIKKQITFIFLLSSIIPICVVGLFAIINARKQMLSHYETQLETEAIRVKSTLFDITTSVRTNTQSIIENQSFRNLFNTSYSDDTKAAYDLINSQLETYYSTSAAIKSINVYTDNPDIPSNGHIYYLPDGFTKEPWYLHMSANTYTTWTSAPYVDRFGNTQYELTLIEKFLTNDSPYSTYLVTRLDSNSLRNRILVNNNIIMASIDQRRVFFSSESGWLWKYMPHYSEFKNQTYSYTGPVTINNKECMTSIKTFIPYQSIPYQSDNHMYVLVSDKNAYDNINQITILYSVILLFATLVPLGIILFFSNYFSMRIQTLKTAMHQASLGDYNIIDTFRGDDELSDTFNDLKTTVNYIHEKETIYYQAKLKEQKILNSQQQMEFKMLASQINPHFLYNTLETIRMQAVAHGNRDVSDSINLLGKTMHYVLENTGTESTTIEKEIKHVISYLEIQRLRFGDRVNYKINVPPYLNLEQFHILPLLLQPIVENSIVHGLEGVTQNGHVEISFILEEPNLYVTIHDNGEGMDEETLQKLKDRIYQKNLSTASSIGLRNINMRLTLMYGEDYGLEVDSKNSAGTTITLTLPLSKIIDKNDLFDLYLMRDKYLEQELEYDE